MNGPLKPMALFGFGVAGLATLANFTVLPSLPSGDPVLAASDMTQPPTDSPIGPNSWLAQSRGNSLAANLQGKPTVVKIYADWCPACQRLKPITNSLQQQFKGKANFVVFDLTNRATTQAAEARAKQLGLSNFLATHRSQTSTVAIINPENGQTLRQFRYNFNSQDYVNAINQAMTQIDR
jgi:thiol-disulfide isomerase/thioredoxin